MSRWNLEMNYGSVDTFHQQGCPQSLRKKVVYEYATIMNFELQYPAIFNVNTIR